MLLTDDGVKRHTNVGAALVKVLDRDNFQSVVIENGTVAWDMSRGTVLSFSDIRVDGLRGEAVETALDLTERIENPTLLIRPYAEVGLVLLDGETGADLEIERIFAVKSWWLNLRAHPWGQAGLQEVQLEDRGAPVLWSRKRTETVFWAKARGYGWQRVRVPADFRGRMPVRTAASGGVLIRVSGPQSDRDIVIGCESSSGEEVVGLFSLTEGELTASDLPEGSYTIREFRTQSGQAYGPVLVRFSVTRGQTTVVDLGSSDLAGSGSALDGSISGTVIVGPGWSDTIEGIALRSHGFCRDPVIFIPKSEIEDRGGGHFAWGARQVCAGTWTVEVVPYAVGVDVEIGKGAEASVALPVPAAARCLVELVDFATGQPAKVRGLQAANYDGDPRRLRRPRNGTPEGTASFSLTVALGAVTLASNDRRFEIVEEDAQMSVGMAGTSLRVRTRRLREISVRFTRAGESVLVDASTEVLILGTAGVNVIRASDGGRGPRRFSVWWDTAYHLYVFSDSGGLRRVFTSVLRPDADTETIVTDVDLGAIGER